MVECLPIVHEPLDYTPNCWGLAMAAGGGGVSGSGCVGAQRGGRVEHELRVNWDGCLQCLNKKDYPFFAPSFSFL